MLDPIVRTIEVPCSQELAFSVFARGMGDWWPLDKRSMSMKDGKRPETLSVDARAGGLIVEVGQDGSEYHWGTFTAFDPYVLLRMDFHMGMPADNASIVEVAFTPLAGNLTKVVLTQSNWEGFGEYAEMLRGHYGSSWVLIFDQAYKQACEDKSSAISHTTTRM
jgi:hypothetical protein